MPTATDTTTIQDLEAQAAEAEARLPDLEAAERRLALDSLSDEDAAEEYRQVQAERAAAEGVVRQLADARQELQRREREAAEEAKRQRRERELDSARELVVRWRETAEKIDAAGAAYAAAVSEFVEIEQELTRTTDRARERFVTPLRGAIQAGLVRYLLDAGVPRGAISLEGINQRPLALAAAIPSQPFEEGE